MAFNSLSDFLMMGAHGVYVWSAYGLTAFAFAWLIWNTLSNRRRVRHTLRQRFKRNHTR